MLELYRLSPAVSVRSATIMRIAGRGITEQLDDEDIEKALRWGELIAFSGLAARNFFVQLGYTSRETFRLVVQNFSDPAEGILTLSRRRDGTSRVFVSRSAASFIQPLNAHSSGHVLFDSSLLNALLARSDQPEWGRYGEAIQGFNAASADSPDVLPETEAVNIVGAFERVFDLSRGKEDELAGKLSATLRPATTILPNNSERAKQSGTPASYLKRKSMREVWVRDFFQLRGGHAHGKMEPSKTSLWTLREHLLLATFAFPLVVKQLLADESYYLMTSEDRADVGAFELLLEPNHFAERLPGDMSAYPWTTIRSESRVRQWVEEESQE